MLTLTAVAVLGGLLPLAVRESSRALHLLLCLAAGFFLGTVFLHFMPELHHIAVDRSEVWTWVLVGLLGVLILDLGIFGHQSHAAVGWATLLGLAVHASMVGLGLGMLPTVSMAFAIGMFAHKFGETFSLVSALRLSVRSRPLLLALLAFFASVTPLSMLLGSAIRDSVPESFHRVVSALAAGSFLYVAVGDILPEVFHEARDRSAKIVLLLVGTAFAALASLGHDHEVEHDHGSHTGADHVHEAVASSPGHFVLGLIEAGWAALCAAAPYLLFGFFVAGLIKVYLPKAFLTRLLGREDLPSILRASLLGAPLPLCSCSVLPTAIGLRRSGASKSATMAFLVSTPETGVDSIAVSAALLDPYLTVARPVGAVVSATAVGVATMLVGGSGSVVEARMSADRQSVADCCEHDGAAAAVVVDVGDKAVEHRHDHMHDLSNEDEASMPGASAKDKLAAACRFGFGPLFDDIVPSLLVGIMIAAAFSMLLPTDILASGLGQGWVGLLLAALLGLPIYVCASASTPVAAALLAKGLSPGAALVFLLVGPATNIASLLVLQREFGRRLVVVYLLVLVTTAIALGALTDWAYDAMRVPVQTALDHGHEASVVGSAAAIVLLLLAARAALRRMRGLSDEAVLDENTGTT